MAETLTFTPPEKDCIRSIIALRALTAETYLRGRNGQMDPEFPDLLPHELADLGTRILDCNSVAEGYDILAARHPRRKKTYYELIFGEVQHATGWAILDDALCTNEPNMVDRALDIGTGAGHGAMILCQRAKQVVGVDISKGMLAVTQQRLQGARRLNFIDDGSAVQVDARSLGFADNSFDIVTTHAIRPYLSPDGEHAMYSEIFRTLKPGGRYYQARQSGQEVEGYATSPIGQLAHVVADAVLYLQQAFGEERQYNLEDLGFQVKVIPYQQRPFPRRVLLATKPR